MFTVENLHHLTSIFKNDLIKSCFARLRFHLKIEHEKHIYRLNLTKFRKKGRSAVNYYHTGK